MSGEQGFSPVCSDELIMIFIQVSDGYLPAGSAGSSPARKVSRKSVAVEQRPAPFVTGKVRFDFTKAWTRGNFVFCFSLLDQATPCW